MKAKTSIVALNSEDVERLETLTNRYAIYDVDIDEMLLVLLRIGIADAWSMSKGEIKHVLDLSREMDDINRRYEECDDSVFHA